MARPTLSLTLPTFGSTVPANEWHRLLDLARAVDDAGVDRVLLTDHVVMGQHLDRYPFGDFHFQPDVPWLEPLSTIAAIAAVTRRVRMSTKILIAPLRPAPLLAKTLATMDQLSQGRVEIGVATGWQRRGVRRGGYRLVTARATAHRHPCGLPSTVGPVSGDLSFGELLVREHLVRAQAISRPVTDLDRGRAEPAQSRPARHAGRRLDTARLCRPRVLRPRRGDRARRVGAGRARHHRADPR